VVVSGATGSGKTTVLGAILVELGCLFPNEYLITIEDTYELKSPSRCWSAQKTTEDVDALKLFQRTLKARPDRIVLGELVDEVAHPFLQSLDGGQRGLVTVHADGIEHVCYRLQSLAGNYAGVNHEHDPWRIAKNVHLIVFCARDGATRRVRDVARIAGYEGNGKYTLTYL
jgi:Flp pilus assembly CpaF family ATPase